MLNLLAQYSTEIVSLYRITMIYLEGGGGGEEGEPKDIFPDCSPLKVSNYHKNNF